MFHSMAHLTTNRDIVRHFGSVSRALSDRGVYVVEMANPKVWFTDPPRSRRQRFEGGSWTESREGLRIRATTYRDPVDYLSETVQVEMVVDVTGRGVSHRINDVSVQRILLPQSVALAAQSGGKLRAVGHYGGFSLDRELDLQQTAGRLISVFSRMGKPGRRAADDDDGQGLLLC
jgi:hypothetical protein